MSGYWFTIDGRAYDAHRNGVPFTLPEVWREVNGVRGARIYAPDGRLVMDAAGSEYHRARWINKARMVRRRGTDGRYKGHANGECGTVGCVRNAVWIPISEGNQGSRVYRCVPCCDRIASESCAA